MKSPKPLLSTLITLREATELDASRFSSDRKDLIRQARFLGEAHRDADLQPLSDDDVAWESFAVRHPAGSLALSQAKAAYANGLLGLESKGTRNAKEQMKRFLFAKGRFQSSVRGLERREAVEERLGALETFTAESAFLTRGPDVSFPDLRMGVKSSSEKHGIDAVYVIRETFGITDEDSAFGGRSRNDLAAKRGLEGAIRMLGPQLSGSLALEMSLEL